MRFDIEDYKAKTDRLRWDDLDVDAAFADRPLDGGTLRCIEYMHDVELHTACYLRDLLLTPAHADPTVTAFLSLWVHEELWHGEALGHVLAAHGRRRGDDRVRPMRAGLGARDALAPFATGLAAAVAGEAFTAVHMAWGAVNEWSTQAGYLRLGQLAGHPTLSELLARIARQEGRHIDFYASQAGERLAASRRARRLARLALGRFWRPVGSGAMPAAETAFVVGHLFAGPACAGGGAAGAAGMEMARRIDRRVDRLPGLSGLRLVEGAVDAVVAAGRGRPDQDRSPRAGDRRSPGGSGRLRAGRGRPGTGWGLVPVPPSAA